MCENNKHKIDINMVANIELKRKYRGLFRATETNQYSFRMHKVEIVQLEKLYIFLKKMGKKMV